MQLSIERAALLRSLGHVQSAVERRNTIPILSNVLLSASAGRVDFHTTDLDLEVADSSPAQVHESGQVTAPAQTFYEIVRELPEGADVSLRHAADDPRLHIEAGRSSFDLPVLPAGDFPTMSPEGLAAPIVIEAGDLMRLIDKTRFAISTQETRYYLNGLYLHSVVADGVRKLRAVATDGYRLALAETAAWDDVSELASVIVPRKAINEARRLMDDASDTVRIGSSARKIRFDFTHAAMTSKVIDGAFPAYERLIPRENNRVLRVESGLFSAAVRRVATVSNEQSRPVGLQVEPGSMTLSVRNVDAGQAVETLEVGYDGEPFEVGFNARYLLDVLAQVGGEFAEFRFAEPRQGALMDPALVLDPADPDVQYVLMPLRA